MEYAAHWYVSEEWLAREDLPRVMNGGRERHRTVGSNMLVQLLIGFNLPRMRATTGPRRWGSRPVPLRQGI